MDEVDNGLYYKTMETLWTALLRSAKQLDESAPDYGRTTGGKKYLS